MRFRTNCLLFALMATLLTPNVATAQKQLSKFVPFRRVDADPNKAYTLTTSHGPWMILAASFAGENAMAEAKALVLELRQRYKVPAYVHKKRYDFTNDVQGLGLDRYGEPKKMKYRQKVAFDEVAVLVGDFPTINDPGMQKALKQLKYSQPTCMSGGERKPQQRFASVRSHLRNLTSDPAKNRKGPLGAAFVTRNPLLPKEYFAPGGIDKMVESINRQVGQYSLLDNPAKFTVKVATFRGNVVIDQKEVQKIESTGEMESRLAEAGEKAHLLTQALRKRGVEAYEFHDRHESVVTIGSFNSVGSPRQDGKMEINPAVLKIMNNYGAHRQQLPGQQTGLVPRSLNGITFDIQPTPVEVPRRSIATDYVQQ